MNYNIVELLVIFLISIHQKYERNLHTIEIISQKQLQFYQIYKYRIYMYTSCIQSWFVYEFLLLKIFIPNISYKLYTFLFTLKSLTEFIYIVFVYFCLFTHGKYISLLILFMYQDIRTLYYASCLCCKSEATS